MWGKGYRFHGACKREIGGSFVLVTPLPLTRKREHSCVARGRNATEVVMYVDLRVRTDRTVDLGAFGE